MRKKPEIIFELANSHDGSYQKLIKIISQFNKINYSYKSIKFQVFKFSEISTKDYNWYPVYQKLYFNPAQWKKIFSLVKNNVKIWIDMFDEYSLEIFKKNINKISGLKFQSSILNNTKVIDSLGKLNLKKKEIIVNISGHNLNEIKNILEKFKKIGANKVIIQAGFQDYPTNLEDLAINKINLLKKNFPKYTYSFADHIDAKNDFSKIIPVLLYIHGYSIIEKHICLDRKKTKYDFYSSLNFSEIKKTIEYINMYSKIISKKFINKKEIQYLKNTVQKTVLNKDVPKYKLLGKSDLSFKRTKKKGLNQKKIFELQEKFYVLKKNKTKDSILKKNDFKKSNIAVLVTCRLKSSRLKNKALLKISGKESILRCLDNSKAAKYPKNVILTTSYLDEDKPLIKIVKKKSKKVKVFAGHPVNIVKRFLVCSNKYNIDTVVRVTGDCPTVSSEIIDLLIKDHFNKKADFTYAKKFSVGTSVEIYSISALKLINEKIPKANYSEYLPWYILNNKNYFKINALDLPKKFIRNYRLTLDYNDDLIFYNKLFSLLKKKKLKPNIINIFKILDRFGHIKKINKNKKLTYLNPKFQKKLHKETKFKI